MLLPFNHPRQRLAASLLAVFWALGSLSCVGGNSPPLNVLVLTWDTTRADRLGPYGYP